MTISGLRRSFGAMIAVEELSLEIAPGELFGLIGPDGAGKTTTMRSLCGLLARDKGEVAVFGLDPLRKPRYVREMIGYMPQRFSLYPDLSVAENLRFFADLYLVPADERRRREERLMQFSKLAPFHNRRAGQLSGGMKQKLALSCTLIHTPKLLILDEPTTGVDPVSRKEFWAILKDLAADGIALLVSTPYMDEALLCDRVALMHKGRTIAVGTPEEIARLYPHRLVEATADDLVALRQNLVAAGFPSSRVHRFGGRLHVACESKRDEVLVEETARSLNGTASRIAPSIEDTFVALAAGKEGKAA